MNYKIKVDSEAESKEAQELFFELGASLGNGDKHAVLVPNIMGLAVVDDLINFVFNDVVFTDIKQCKEITLPELRDLVVLKRNSIDDATHGNPMYPYIKLSDGWYYFDESSKWLKSTGGKQSYYDNLKPITKEEGMKEYLNPKQDYKLVTCNIGETPFPNNWIEVPEGALFAYETGSTGLLFTGNKRDAYKGFLVWQRETLNDKVASAETARQAEKVLKEILEGEDLVNSPSHYANSEIECIDAMRAMLTPEQFKGYLRGNAFKYLWRYEKKGGVESLKKGQWYLNKLIEVEDEKTE